MIFSRLYDITMTWAKHKNAERFLGLMSFSESVIFPIPVDVMLAPMSLAKPDNAWRYALVASVTSVLGGIFGYLLGLFFFESVIQPYAASIGYQHKLEHAITWFEQYGVWVVFISGFSPIPYGVFLTLLVQCKWRFCRLLSPQQSDAQLLSGLWLDEMGRS